MTALIQALPTAPEPPRHPADGAAPLVRRLVQERGARWVDAATLGAFLATPGEAALFFHGDAVRFPEALDVAVVLPELQASAVRRFAIGVVSLADEDAVARRFGSTRWPALVFLRDGCWLGTVSGMHDWTDYLEQVNATLAKAPSRPPIAIQASGGEGASCH